MLRTLLHLLRDEGGATAIEYGLIAALIAVAAIVGITTAGSSIQGVFNYSANRATSVWDNAMN
jgi:pilus assembly protein Flp/PilA